MAATPRLSLPFLTAGQAQKETTVNESLQILDFAVAGSAVAPPQSDPPENPDVGDCYIVGAEPSGAWAGRAGALAGFSEGGWRFIAPADGMSVYVSSLAQWANYAGEAWEIGSARAARLLINGVQVVGAQAEAIAAPSDGATVDVEARAAIGQILAALRIHGLIAA
jgi:hypothetical protein